MQVIGRILPLACKQVELTSAQNGSAAEKSTISPSDAVAYLERLPAGAWPYGLVVVVSESGPRNPGDDVPIKRNLEELIRLLKTAGIKVELWPSA